MDAFKDAVMKALTDTEEGRYPEMLRPANAFIAALSRELDQTHPDIADRIFNLRNG